MFIFRKATYAEQVHRYRDTWIFDANDADSDLIKRMNEREQKHVHHRLIPNALEAKKLEF